jgi:hypothetical protein
LVAPTSPAAAQSPPEAVTQATTNAAANGVTSFISVVDRASGAVLGQTANAGTQVASESIMKLFLASYYLLLYGGYVSTPQSVKDRLRYMLVYSDDATASSLFTASAIPTVAARYGLDATINATDRVGHWGAARITANDMTRFLFRSSQDPAVGPWLIPVMTETARTGSGEDAGFSQYFGLNALGGDHGSKQGWGCDSFWTAPQCAVHSVGYTDRYFVAVLQLSSGYPDPMRATATTSAQLIQMASGELGGGDFIADLASGAVYRMAGGAPIYVSTWGVFGGVKPVRWMTGAQIAALPQYPVNGTQIRDPISGAIYLVAGGAPVYVSQWAAVNPAQPIIDVDPAAIAYAGQGSVWMHLRYRPADGTLLGANPAGGIFRVAGGAPIYVSSWSAVGGYQPYVDVDAAAIDNAGTGGVWNHLSSHPADGTFLGGNPEGAIYRVAGGAPIYVSSWSAVGGFQAYVDIDSAAINMAGSGGIWNHLRYYPADGTFIGANPPGAIYRVEGGTPRYVPSWSPYGGPQSYVDVDSAAVTNAGAGGFWNHLRPPG